MNFDGIVRRGTKALPLLALLAASLWQTAQVGEQFGQRLVAKVWANRQLDAISRSADVAYGEDYRLYIEFLRQGIPEDARVVILQTSGLPQYQSRSFLQYFLFPRRLVVCAARESVECIWDWRGPDTYFIYKGEIHVPVVLRAEIEQVELRQGEGFLAPLERAPR